MATPRWIGAALPVAQVDSITVANTWTAGDTATVTINNKSLVLTVGATVTTTAVAQAIVEMINGDTITGDATRSETGDNVPEFQEVTATLYSASVVRVTGDTKGIPFTMTVTENTAGTGTATRAAVTAATGPNHFDNANNWDTGSVPVDGDTVYVDNSSVDILYALDQSAIELAALYIGLSFTGQIGLPEVNETGGYHEYRSQYLSIGPLILQIGAGAGNGSGRIKINSTSDPCAITIYATGTSADDLPAVLWKGSDSTNTLAMRSGSVGIAVFGGEAATLASFTVDGGDLTLGAGVTLSGDLVVNGGSVRINSHIDGTMTLTGGNLLIDGTGAVDQLTVRGSGVVVYNTTGTLGGNTVVSGNGVLDFSQASGSVSVTNAIDLSGTNAQILDPLKRTGAVVIDFNESASVAQVSLGLNYRITRGSVA